ncbi:hypothetical protein MTO96_048255 [Rhipicephalus appendiculatus]
MRRCDQSGVVRGTRLGDIRIQRNVSWRVCVRVSAAVHYNASYWLRLASADGRHLIELPWAVDKTSAALRRKLIEAWKSVAASKEMDQQDIASGCRKVGFLIFDNNASGVDRFNRSDIVAAGCLT